MHERVGPGPRRLARRRAQSAKATTGPATVAVGVLASCRRFSPRVQIAPETAHSRPAASVTVTSPSPSGSTVIRHRSWRLSTRRARVTSPPSTVNEASLIDRKLIPISSLNATRKWNASSPSCASGRPSNAAVSASGSGLCTVADSAEAVVGLSPAG